MPETVNIGNISARQCAQVLQDIGVQDASIRECVDIMGGRFRESCDVVVDMPTDVFLFKLGERVTSEKFFAVGDSMWRNPSWNGAA
jgi:hypothetical protein